MVYRTPAPHDREGAAAPRPLATARRAVVALRRASRPGTTAPGAFVALALAAGWRGVAAAPSAEAKGFVALALAYALSAACARHLWARAPRRGLLDGDELGKKLGWSIALALPVIGPLFYGAVYDPLPPSDLPNRSLRWLGW